MAEETKREPQTKESQLQGIAQSQTPCSCGCGCLPPLKQQSK